MQLCDCQMQGLTKLVIQKFALITSELEATVWSGMFQKLCPVLNTPPMAFHSCRAAQKSCQSSWNLIPV